MNNYELTTPYGTYNVSVYRSNYVCNDNLAICLIDNEDGCSFADLSVNLSDYVLLPNQAFVDTNNCPWAEDFIKENKLGVPCDIVGHSGFCSYPLYTFNVESIEILD